MSRRRNPCCPCFRMSSKYQHDKIQKKTFTKWINYHLETHNSSRQVEDLFEDLRDGVLLCHLIEVLTGEALPVHKGRVSKRVHHISNLTTALTVLRRRGLELINNNPTDLADGNPRIVLGLVWQMILHFQVESNLQLLAEWGFEAPASTSSTSSAASTPIGKLKSSVDRVILRWVSAEVAKKHGIPVSDMDKSWRDGVAFNALVHRSRPELVDMERVRRSTPRENIESAFRLAEEHLNIRPLLDVEDVLCDKPDKRSIITYVTQFIRVTTSLRPIEPQPLGSPSVTRFRSLIQWIASTSQVAMTFDPRSDLYAQYQVSG
uniref:Calponin-homology (CH) domain-containing protein n=1 Tax=Steinernema glaseri TaxID=37863 RepID=A0A1I7YZM1_9BILA